MKKLSFALVTAFVATIVVFHFGTTSYAAENNIVVKKAYAFETAGLQKNGAAFVVLNLKEGASDDLLLGASGNIAERIELHSFEEKDGILKMVVKDAGTLSSDTTYEMSPKGDHIMLIGLKKPLAAGQSFPLTLNFKNNAAVEVDVKVKSLKDMVGHSHDHHGHHHDHGDHHH